jgi:PKD repeat protein
MDAPAIGDIMTRLARIVPIALLAVSCRDAMGPTATPAEVDAAPADLSSLSLAPASGPTAGGTPVTIYSSFTTSYVIGWNCSWWGCVPRIEPAQHFVYFGNTQVPIVNKTTTWMTVVSPPGLPGWSVVRVVECAPFCVETGTLFTYVDPNRAPVANAGGPYAVTEGATITFNGTASTDPDGHALIHDWSFGDGSTAFNTGPAPSHVYADNGTYIVSLAVRDPFGATGTSSAVVSVANAAPIVSALPDATIMRGESWVAAGSYTDAGADSHTALVGWGDSASEPVTLTAGAFSLTHQYSAAGTFTVTVTVTDDDGGSGVSTARIVVLSPAGASTALSMTLDALVADGALPEALANSLTAPIDAATASLARGNTSAASGQLGAFVNRLDAAVRTGRMGPAVAASLKAYVDRIRTSMGP